MTVQFGLLALPVAPGLVASDLLAKDRDIRPVDLAATT